MGFRLRVVLIVTKSAFSKNHRKKFHFGIIFGGPNHQKSMKNRVRNDHFFKHRFFFDLLRLIVILARFWEAPGAPKIDKKSKKSCLGRFWDVGAIWGAILDRLLQILDGFWQDFERFWRLFGRIWREKQWLGRPRESQWMDGGVLIRYLGKWMTFRKPLGLGFRGRARWGELRDRWGPWAYF